MSKAHSTHRPRSEQQDLQAFPLPDDPDAANIRVSRPQVLRTNREVMLVFGAQRLGEPDEKGHRFPIASSTLHWAVSTDGGRQWKLSDRAPELGRILQASCGVPVQGGGMATITFQRASEPCLALLQKGQVGWAPGHKDLPLVGSEPLQSFGPYGNFWFHEAVHTSDGAMLAGGCGVRAGASVGNRPETSSGVEIYFLRSQNGGRSWGYLAPLPNPNGLSLGAFGILPGESGYVLAVMQAKATADPDEPTELHQSYSLNHGRKWSDPEPMSIEGESPSLFRLRNGFVVMLSTRPSDPCSVQTLLSDDDGATWNTHALRCLRSFEPVVGGFGNAQAVQLQDGTILCAYHGYTTEQRAGTYNPGGIFVSLFDEDWVRRGEVAPLRQPE